MSKIRQIGKLPFLKLKNRYIGLNAITCVKFVEGGFLLNSKAKVYLSNNEFPLEYSNDTDEYNTLKELFCEDGMVDKVIDEVRDEVRDEVVPSEFKNPNDTYNPGKNSFPRYSSKNKQ